MSTQSISEQQAKMIRQAELDELDPISFEELQAIFDEWMLIPDRFLLKYIISCYCANELSQRPVWSIIVAPSGGGKTEVLNSLLCLPKIRPISSLTANTFLSGMPGGKDASLLPKINGMILVFKDWTVVLSLQKDARAEIFGQFRDIFDGSMTKEFGNGQSRTWNGKVSILAACTEAVDLNQQQYTHLGERFIFYRPTMPDRTEVAYRALANSAHQSEMTKTLQNAMYAFIKGIDFSKYDELPRLTKDHEGQLVKLTEFATKARSGVIRDFGFKKDVLFVPTPEMPTRLLQQVSLIGQGAMIANGGGELTQGDMAMLYKTILDSIPRTNRLVINEMARGEGQTTAAIATALGYPTDTIRTYLENQALLGVCTRSKVDGKGDRWTLNQEYTEIIQKFDEIQTLSSDELKDREQATKTPDEIAQEEMWNEIP